MQVQIETLENLKVVNFYVDGMVDKSALLFDENSAKLPDFVKNIFEYSGGGRFLITPELIAFKYPENADVETLKMLIMAEVEDFFANPNDLSEFGGEKDVLSLAQAIADSYIRPTLNRDKGDIEILNFEGNTLSIKFVGHCAGCPFAQNTLNNVIAKALKRFIPNIKEIRLVE